MLYRMCLHEVCEWCIFLAGWRESGGIVIWFWCFKLQFIERSLCDGEGIEIFIEGSRSRSGKVNSPKAGLLSVIVDSVKRGQLKVWISFS